MPMLPSTKPLTTPMPCRDRAPKRTAGPLARRRIGASRRHQRGRCATVTEQAVARLANCRFPGHRALIDDFAFLSLFADLFRRRRARRPRRFERSLRLDGAISLRPRRGDRLRQLRACSRSAPPSRSPEALAARRFMVSDERAPTAAAACYGDSAMADHWFASQLASSPAPPAVE